MQFFWRFTYFIEFTLMATLVLANSFKLPNLSSANI